MMLPFPVACSMQRIGHAEPKLGRNVATVLIPILGGSPAGARRSHPVKNPAAPRLQWRTGPPVPRSLALTGLRGVVTFARTVAQPGIPLDEAALFG